MKSKHKVLASGLMAAASLTMGLGTSQAVIYNESSDAGQTLAAAKSTGTNATTPLQAITGSLGSASDADLYAITITSAGAFSATTNNVASSNLDTAIFLFSASGAAIATNDDAPGGTSFDSTLPAGNALYATLTPGTYFIGISSSGNEAVNTASQLLFAGYPGGDTTAVRGTATGLNPATESTFNGNESDPTTFGGYEIDFTGRGDSGQPAGGA